MKLASILALCLTGCGIFSGGVKSPRDGLYCLNVTAAGVPGEALVCYSTQAAMLKAQQDYEAKGVKATVAK